VNPQWTTDITFYRLQNFPAGKTIEVTHKYRPVPRFFFKSSDEIAGAEMRKSFCPDNSFLNAAKAAQKTGALQGVELRYIIKNGAQLVRANRAVHADDRQGRSEVTRLDLFHRPQKQPARRASP
jgi:hypothetical protein